MILYANYNSIKRQLIGNTKYNKMQFNMLHDITKNDKDKLNQHEQNNF